MTPAEFADYVERLEQVVSAGTAADIRRKVAEFRKTFVPRPPVRKINLWDLQNNLGARLDAALGYAIRSRLGEGFSLFDLRTRLRSVIQVDGATTFYLDDQPLLHAGPPNTRLKDVRAPIEIVADQQLWMLPPDGPPLPLF